MHHQGKEYTWKMAGNKVKFLIDEKDGSEIRNESFYKYYALSKNSVDALTHLYLYATHPCQLNDPLDCADNLIDFDDIESARAVLGDLYTEVAEMYNNDENAILEFTKVGFRTYYYMKMGIFCLSNNCINISMWSSYTEHKGFCVEFDVNSFPYDFWGPFELNYQKELESVSVNRASLPLAALIQTNIKLDCWQHEHEYRLLIQCPEGYYMEPYGYKSELFKSRIADISDRKLKYPLRCIKSVCLGMKFFNGIHAVMTDFENEYVAFNEDQNKILSFLALTKIPTYVLENKGLMVERHQIEIIQIRNDSY
jgi:hypothetical protein